MYGQYLSTFTAFYSILQELESCDPRVSAVNLNAMSWDTYSQLEHDNLLNDVEIRDWQRTFAWTL